MLGTAVVGTLINYQYGEAIRTQLEALPTSLVNSLQDPQVLMSVSQQTRFLEQAGQEGQVYLGLARDALAHAVNMGMAVTLLLIVWCFYWVRKVPPIRFNRQEQS
jgi:hypothetical protein